MKVKVTLVGWRSGNILLICQNDRWNWLRKWLRGKEDIALDTIYYNKLK